uniref:Uncharacterized protein n=1 Tax=Parascaris equorum TaxID=6256 RepID=A0A914S2G8_PAREQ
MTLPYTITTGTKEHFKIKFQTISITSQMSRFENYSIPNIQRKFRSSDLDA